MLFTSIRRQGGGGTLEKLMPGYKDKIWAKVPKEYKIKKIEYDNGQFNSFVQKHKNFQSKYDSYKAIEEKFTPSQKFRKPSVDWRRQLARGTLHIGRWHEGPGNTDYTPGNTRDRLKDSLEPFTAGEWEEKKQYRHWDALKVTLGGFGVWMFMNVSNNYPVVWC